MYKAFISYNRADVDLARFLQRRLETYVVPKAVVLTELQGRTKRPLYPIFRDEDEMIAGGRLSDRLRGAIAKSEYLIVICSPAAASLGEWVDLEIREFLAQHGPDRILAVVVAGEPNAVSNGHDASEECLPPSLLGLFENRASQPLWVDMRSDRRDRSAFLRVVAALLNIDSLDQLVRRDASRRRQQRRIFAGAAAAVAAVMLLLGVSFFHQRSLAQGEAANVALSRARNALLAGRAQEGYSILRDAYEAGIRGAISEALINMASWLPFRTDLRATAENPILLRQGENYSILHVSGTRTPIGRNPKAILYTHAFSRAVVYSPSRLEVFSLGDGRKLSSMDLQGLELTRNAPVIAAPSGTLALGLINQPGVVREQQSFLVIVSDAGKVSEPVRTHLEELDGERDDANMLHLGSVPIIQGDCRYIGFLRPEVAEARWSPGADMQAAMSDFVFFELRAEGLTRVQGPVEASQFNGVIPTGVLPYQPSIRPDGPDGPATGTNLDQLNDYCAGKISRDLREPALGQSVVEIGTNADREPHGWWTADPPPPPGEPYPFEVPEPNPCASRPCRVITPRPLMGDGSTQEPGWELFTWGLASLPRSTTRRADRLVFGSQVSGQVGHEHAICRIPGSGTIDCAVFRGSDMLGPGFAGEAISPDGSMVFAAGTNNDGVPGFALLRLGEGKLIEAWKSEGPDYSGELADFAAGSRSLCTLDSSGTLTSYKINGLDLKVSAASRSSFVPPFDVQRSSLDDEATRASPIPVALRHVADDAVLIARRDGGIALISPANGREIWQSRFSGIGPLKSATLSPNRRIAMIQGESGVRLIDTATGMPVSGVFGYPAQMVVDSAGSELWVADDGRARIANVARKPRPRLSSVAEAVERLDSYFRG